MPFVPDRDSSATAARFIRHASRRAKRAAARRGRPLREDEVGAITVPTAPPWQRTLLIIAGMLLIVAAFALFLLAPARNGLAIVAAIMITAAGGSLVAIGLWGQRKSVDQATAQLGENVCEVILRAIFEAAISI